MAVRRTNSNRSAEYLRICFALKELQTCKELYTTGLADRAIEYLEERKTKVSPIYLGRTLNDSNRIER